MNQAVAVDAREIVRLVRDKKGERELKPVAAEAGVSFQFLSKVLKGGMAPGPKLAAWVGYEQVVAFRPLATSSAGNGSKPPSAAPASGKPAKRPSAGKGKRPARPAARPKQKKPKPTRKAAAPKRKAVTTGSRKKRSARS